ncbi:MAG TPA: hypothetical protein VGM81_20980 [Burkholderiaceae bacterium]|jgi:hypothetical protein
MYMPGKRGLVFKPTRFAIADHEHKVKIMRKAAKRVIGMALTLTAFAVIAKFWGPFLVVVPGTSSFADDDNNNMVSSQNTPRMYMGSNVSQIQKGDIVRIIYQNGDVYDMEAKYQCTSMASNACIWSKMTKKDSPNAAPTISLYAKTFWMNKFGPCEGNSESNPKTIQVAFKTSRWTTEWPDSGTPDIVISKGYWLDTGEVYATMPGPMRLGGFCK